MCVGKKAHWSENMCTIDKYKCSIGKYGLRVLHLTSSPRCLSALPGKILKIKLFLSLCEVMSSSSFKTALKHQKYA